MSFSPRSTEAWQRLERYAAEKRPRIDALLENDKERLSWSTLAADGIRFDYARTDITFEVRHALLDLAQQMQLAEWIGRMRIGEKINHTEDRAVLHVALRDLTGRYAPDYGEDVKELVQGELQKLRLLCGKIRSGEWLGYTGKPIRHLVNIGIGGSDLGPKMICEALREQWDGQIQAHFASNVDDTHLLNLVRRLPAEETLFCISSKTFTTQETMCNAHLARDWLIEQLGSDAATSQHFIAVSTNADAAEAFGIDTKNLLGFWDWVGGRFSLWSSIGLPIALSYGVDTFEQLLAGAHALDTHFFETPFEHNIPVWMALAGIWQNNFRKRTSLGVIPYNDALGLLPMFLQQLDMESNGKSIDRNGTTVDYATGPVVWGQAGSNGQHAFFQSLHQGTQVVPLEFVIALNPGSKQPEQHRVLLSNLLAQSRAMMAGEQAEEGAPHTHYAGDKPSCMIALTQLDAFNLGQLIAAYEHKIFVQGVIWNLNSFDQWGVQLGKRLANEIGTDFSAPAASVDAASRELMAWIESGLSA